ncbi:hypothetical protein M9H77_26861 [Catharanthus roseus]|uniref:Uncharacterized protein n=1 Tax=Catharanthus roseus TaxID=4058 RepID=A0ACC0ADK9_CATRO|nr:hypothetical protein M9H77_26861 [Catharanthus roseus]
MHKSSAPHRASSDGVDVSYSGEWIHLKRGVDRGGCDPISLRGHRIMLCNRVGCLVESQEGIETKVGPRTDLVETVLMYLDSLRLPSCARNPHVGSGISIVKKPLMHTHTRGLTEHRGHCREAHRYPTQPQLT